MTQLQKILSGLAILQIVLIGVVFWPEQTAVTETGPLLAELIPANITQITITDESGSLMFARNSGQWQIPNSGNFPANSNTVNDALNKLLAIQTNRRVAQNSDSHRRLQVDTQDFVRQIDFEMEDGNNFTLYIGSSGNNQATNVRLATSDDTYATTEFQNWEFTSILLNWIDTTYIDLNQSDIERITIENGIETLAFSKGENGRWSLASLADGELPSINQIDLMLRRITGLRIVQPLGTENLSEYGITNAQGRVTVETAVSSHTILIGNADPDSNTHTIKWSDSDYYVTTNSFNIDPLLEATSESFIEQPPPPAPSTDG